MKNHLFNINHISDENLAAYINGDIDGKKKDRIKRHLKKCPQCFEHYTLTKKVISETVESSEIILTEEVMDKARNISLDSVKINTTLYRFMKRIAESINIIKEKIEFQFISMKSGVKLAYALGLILIIGFSLLLVFQSEKTIQNIPLSDYLVISGEDPLGFVGEQERIEYSGMKVFLGDNENEIIFFWPEIKDAQFYNVYLIGDKKHQISSVGGLTTNSLIYQLNKIEMNKKYLWEITGKLKNGRMFQARSSFIRIDKDS